MEKLELFEQTKKLIDQWIQFYNQKMVIWYHSGESADTEALELALRSPLITHVCIKYRHRRDGKWQDNDTVKKAIELVLTSKAKLIWARTMWPWYAVENSPATVAGLYKPAYYIRQIRNVRSEGARMGADMVALDTEPYANSPMKHFFKGDNRIRLTADEMEEMDNAVNQVLANAGKVNITFPAGSMITASPTNYLSRLGELRVSTHTYYDNLDAIKNIKYEYELFGVHLNTLKIREGMPSQVCYLPHEMFNQLVRLKTQSLFRLTFALISPYLSTTTPITEQLSYRLLCLWLTTHKELWGDKKGLWIYTSTQDSLAVAKALVEYGQENR